MKLSRLSLLLILIGSALVLSAEPPSPKSKPSTQDQRVGLTGDINKETKKDKDSSIEKASPHPAPSPQVQPTTNPVDGQPDTHNKGIGTNKRDESWWRRAYDWLARISAQGFSNFAIAVATIFLAIFTCQLVKVTRNMQAATQDSAKATIESAKVAQLALHADRPFLVIDISSLAGFVRHITEEERKLGQEDERLRASFRLKNCGKGPAIIE